MLAAAKRRGTAGRCLLDFRASGCRLCRGYRQQQRLLRLPLAAAACVKSSSGSSSSSSSTHPLGVLLTASGTNFWRATAVFSVHFKGAPLERGPPTEASFRPLSSFGGLCLRSFSVLLQVGPRRPAVHPVKQQQQQQKASAAAGFEAESVHVAYPDDYVPASAPNPVSLNSKSSSNSSRNSSSISSSSKSKRGAAVEHLGFLPAWARRLQPPSREVLFLRTLPLAPLIGMALGLHALPPLGFEALARPCLSALISYSAVLLTAAVREGKFACLLHLQAKQKTRGYGEGSQAEADADGEEERRKQLLFRVFVFPLFSHFR
ncbi:hypothetical protein Efla_003255 [Eimeria flavescens]